MATKAQNPIRSIGQGLQQRNAQSLPYPTQKPTDLQRTAPVVKEPELVVEVPVDQEDAAIIAALVAMGHQFTEGVTIKTSNSAKNPGRRFVTDRSDFICWTDNLTPPIIYATQDDITNLNEMGWVFSSTKDVTVKVSTSDANPGRKFFSYYHKVHAPKSVFVGWADDLESCRKSAPLTPEEEQKLIDREGSDACFASLRICRKEGANYGQDFLVNKEGDFICFRRYL